MVVLSDRYWRRRFGANPSIVGETVTINRIPFTIVGITPPEFSGISLDRAPDLWIPLHAIDRFSPNRGIWEESFAGWLQIAGRLRSGISRPHAQAELDVIYRQQQVEQLSAVERPSQFIQRKDKDLERVVEIFQGDRCSYECPDCPLADRPQRPRK